MSARKPSGEQQEAIERLREWLRPGDTVYTILRHVSRSGMQRTISALQLESAGAREHYAGSRHGNLTIGDLSYNVASALGWPMDRERDGVKVSGCGEDWGFALVYALGNTLWPDGFGCIGEGCPSADHANGDRDYTPHRDDRRVVEWRLRGDGEEGSAVGEWRDREPHGKRQLYVGGETWLSYWLFDDEIVSDEPAAAHWHRSGGYALRQRWL